MFCALADLKPEFNPNRAAAVVREAQFRESKLAAMESEFKKMKGKKSAEKWTEDWITSVANGGNTMSSRKLDSIDKRGGGLNKAASVARKQKVHLVLLEDDKGDKIVAASKKPFKVIA